MPTNFTTMQTPFTHLGLDEAQLMSMLGFTAAVMEGERDIQDFAPMLFPKSESFPVGAIEIKKRVYGGLSGARAWDGLTTIPPATKDFLYDLNVRETAYGNAVELTWAGNRWDMYKTNAKNPQELYTTCAIKRNDLAFYPFNNGFAGAAWFDGQQLFSASHPVKNLTTGATTVQGNLQTGARTPDTIHAMLVRGYNMRDYNGRPMQIKPKTLYVHPTEVHNARNDLNLAVEYKAGYGNFDQNPFKSKDWALTDSFVQGSPYLDTTTKYLMQWEDSDGCGSYKYDGKAIGLEVPVRQTNGSIYQAITFCFTCWVERYQYWQGSLGT